MMEMTSSNQRALVEQQKRKHIELLLESYPNVEPAEEAEILRFLKKGPQLEVGFLTSNEALKPKLDQFRKDHKSEFAIGAKELAVIALIIVAVVALSVLLWDSGATR